MTTKTPPPPQFKLRLDPGLKVEIERAAEEHGVSINAEVNNRLAYSFLAETVNKSFEERLAAQEQLNAAQRSLIRSLSFYLKEVASRVPHSKDPLTNDLMRHIRNFATHMEQGDMKAAEPDIEAVASLSHRIAQVTEG